MLSFRRNEYFTVIMINCNENKLMQLATRFRTAILKSDPKTLEVTLSNFPRGSCGDATLLLAKYLEENKCGKFDYVCGECKGFSHAWLQRDRLIIDITADQFDDQNCPVIVTKDHFWHSQFNGEVQHIADFMIYDQNTICRLSNSYEHIKHNINTQQKRQTNSK